MTDDLPTELIERVWHYAAALDVATCRAICSTNRLGWRVAIPHLYREPRISAYRADIIGDDLRLYRLSLLTRTLLDRPRLAKYVQTVCLWFDDFSRFRRRCKVAVPINNEALRRTVAEKSSISFDLSPTIAALLAANDRNHKPLPVNDDIVSVKPGMFLAIIMLACPSLRSIKVSAMLDEFYFVNTLYEALRKNSRQHNRPFDATDFGMSIVEEISLRGFKDRDIITTDKLLSLFYWPTLRKINLTGLACCDGYHPEFRVGSQQNFEEFYVSNSTAQTEDFQALFFKMQKLKVISIAWDESREMGDAQNWRGLATSLTHQTPLLEELRLYPPPRQSRRELVSKPWLGLLDGPRRPKYYEGLGDILGLKNLRRFSAPKLALFGWFDDHEEVYEISTLADRIPESLEEIEIFCDGPEFTDHDKALLTAPGTARLQDVIIVNSTQEKSISRTHGEREYCTHHPDNDDLEPERSVWDD